MKTIKWLLAAGLSLSLPMVKAQGLLDKVDKILNKTERASNQTERAGKTAGKIGKLLNKENKSGQKTVIRISGIDYAYLQELQDDIETFKGITSVSGKFEKGVSKITVLHTTTSEDLLDQILKNSKIIPKDAIEEVSENVIGIKLK
ncbi:hypothetical protein BV902_00940 [Sphingobacterium sp. B29]|uniref:hypothetical protein n=1 Tax=Sphingobacterium sp. B29 TaxID=1933220 RepID=UPI00095830A0|nr:hypothetical protein [Sphingobacterium sp. B29]APU95066.1 hypothetical protein BV902_00940 [Sphingobacterium sp. B29]